MDAERLNLARGAILIFAMRMCVAQQTSDFDGTWVLRLDGQNIFKLTLATERGALTGSLTKPKKLVIAQEGMRPWNLERASDGDAIILASSLSEPRYPEEIRVLREQLRAMVKDEQDARLAFDEARIEAEDAKNRPEVLRIFSRYGWVTNSLAGKDAAHDFWLLIQHQTPEIQGRLLPALEKAAETGNAAMGDYAYLYDRVQVGLGRPQHWGTQTHCEDGKPVMAPVDDPAGLDAR